MNVQQILKKVRIIKANENKTDIEFFRFCFFPRAISAFVSKYYTHVTPPLFFFFSRTFIFFFCNLVFFIFHIQERITITVTLIIQKKITFTGTMKITVLHKKGKKRHYVHNHYNLRKKDKGEETLAKFSFTECLARFFSISHSA